jgi:hypothetical protein
MTRRWVQREDIYLRANYKTVAYSEIAEDLRRTTVSVAHRASKLGLIKNRLRRWTDDEDLVIVTRAQTDRIASVARQLNRRESEVSKRARSLGVQFRKPTKGVDQQGRPIRAHVDGKRVMEHRAVMEDHLGRPLREGEIVHHIDQDKTNNSLENLYICKGRAGHLKAHHSLNVLATSLLQDGVIIFNGVTGTYERT